MNANVTISKNGKTQTIETTKGGLLSNILKSGHYYIDMPCGGKGVCKGCTVLVNGEKRLACQTRIEGDIYIELNPSAEFSNIAVANESNTPPVDRMYSRYGLSIDIGTTTLCASLFDERGAGITIARKNPQTSFGADIISRIEKALSGEAKMLADCIRLELAEMTTELCQAKGISSNMIDAAVITANTAMLYLLTEENPKALSHAPFWANRLFGEYIDASDLVLPLSSNARVYLARCASAFIGADITTAIIASGICEQNKTALLVDVGTNGEIALWHGGKITCCSTAAGPAFEGAQITHGVYGIDGAIDHVYLDDGRVNFSTIGGSDAIGICGSGIVDALALMLEIGIVDETGAFISDSDLFEIRNGIGITALDVRKIQLAKGSIRAGIETLLHVSNVDKSQVERLYIAGGFGSFINLENAAIIGLIPKEFLPRTSVIGNAAHTGASMLLCNKSLTQISEHIAAAAQTVSLDANSVFTDYFMECMMFEVDDAE